MPSRRSSREIVLVNTSSGKWTRHVARFTQNAANSPTRVRIVTLARVWAYRGRGEARRGTRACAERTQRKAAASARKYCPPWVRLHCRRYVCVCVCVCVCVRACARSHARVCTKARARMNVRKYLSAYVVYAQHCAYSMHTAVCITFGGNAYSSLPRSIMEATQTYGQRNISKKNTFVMEIISKCLM